MRRLAWLLIGMAACSGIIGCEGDGAKQEDPPPPPPPLPQLIAPIPMSLTIVTKGSEATNFPNNIYTTTMTNDVDPDESDGQGLGSAVGLGKFTGLGSDGGDGGDDGDGQPQDGGTGGDPDAPPENELEEIEQPLTPPTPRLGLYRVDQPLTFRMKMKHQLLGVAKDGGLILRWVGTSTPDIEEARLLYVAPGKKLTEAVTILRNRRLSQYAHAYDSEKERIVFVEYKQAKPEWRYRDSEGKEDVVAFAEDEIEKASIVPSVTWSLSGLYTGGSMIPAITGSLNRAARGGYILYSTGAGSPYLNNGSLILADTVENKVYRHCVTHLCSQAQLLLHSTDGPFISYLDHEGNVKLVNKDSSKSYTLLNTIEDDSVLASYHVVTGFLPSGELPIYRVIERQATGDHVDKDDRDLTVSMALMNLADTSPRIVYEYTRPRRIDLIQGPLFQRRYAQIVAMQDRRILLAGADEEVTATTDKAKPVVAKSIASVYSWVEPDGSLSPAAEFDAEATMVAYWPQSGVAAFALKKDVPQIVFVNLNSGERIHTLDRAVVPAASVASQQPWEYLLVATETERNGEWMLSVYHEALRREIGVVTGDVEEIYVTPFAGAASKSWTADETLIPELSISMPEGPFKTHSEISITFAVEGPSGLKLLKTSCASDNVLAKIGAFPYQLAPGQSLAGQESASVTINYKLLAAEHVACSTTIEDDLGQTKSVSFTITFKEAGGGGDDGDGGGAAVTIEGIGFAYTTVPLWAIGIDPPSLFIGKVTYAGGWEVGMQSLDPTKPPWTPATAYENLPKVQVTGTDEVPIMTCTTNAEGAKGAPTPVPGLASGSDGEFAVRYHYTTLPTDPNENGLEDCEIYLPIADKKIYVRTRWHLNLGL